MKILFLTSRLPFPPDRGDRLRTYQFLRAFSAEHDLTLVSFITHPRQEEFAKELFAYCREIHLISLPAWKSRSTIIANIWRDYPLQVLYYRSRQMRRKVDDLVAGGNYDLAYVHLFRMAPYLLHHKDLYRILDYTDLISAEIASSIAYQPPLWRALYRLEQPRIERFEKVMAPLYDELWFICSHDRARFAGDVFQQKIHVVPNGIREDLLLASTGNASPNRLVFLGNLEVKHNIDALNYLVLEILPLIRHEAPVCELHIIGAGKNKAVMDLNRYPGVHAVGYVEDLAQALTSNAIAVAPLRFSAGVQNKVIEAMAVGLPVVASSSVNAGLAAESEREILLADNAQDFASQVLRLQRDKHLRSSVAKAGREFATAHFSIETALKRLRVLNEQLVGSC